MYLARNAWRARQSYVSPHRLPIRRRIERQERTCRTYIGVFVDLVAVEIIRHLVRLDFDSKPIERLALAEFAGQRQTVVAVDWSKPAANARDIRLAHHSGITDMP